jgi:DNA-binding transcriptional LysR family regulator
MNIDTIALQCFIAVAETGSFTKAADRVGRTQSAVSQQVAKLENLLGKTLFVRGKTFSLTPDGEIFFGYARQIVALHHEAFDRFTKPELEGELRFGLPENFASVYLSDVLAEFTRVHPRVLLNVECDLTLNLFERFKRNEFDLVLVKMNRPENFPNGLNVWSEPLCWVGDANLIDKEKPIPLVLSPQPCVYRAAAIKALNENGQKWRLVLSSPSYAGMGAAVKAGMGITVIPHTMIPLGLHAIDASILPKLEDTHVSLLKHRAGNAAINSLEEFVLRKFHH